MSTIYNAANNTYTHINSQKPIRGEWHNVPKSNVDDELMAELVKMAKKAEILAQIEKLAENNPHVKELYEELMFIVNLQSEHE